MKRLQLVIETREEEKVDIYLELMNGIFKLTPTQLKVLKQLVRENPGMCTPLARKNVTESMGFASIKVTNNFIKVLKDKGLIIKDPVSGTFRYDKMVIPPADLEVVEFTFDYGQG